MDGRADLFSLGVVCYELLSGTRPFRGDNPTALMYSVARSSYVPLSKVAQKKIEDRTLEGSPSIAIKLQRVRKRLKAALEGKGFDAEPVRSTKSKAKYDDDGLPTRDVTPDEDD